MNDGANVILDDDQLYRRLSSHQINPDGSVNSSAFKRGDVYETMISVDVARMTTPEASVERAKKAGVKLGGFGAGRARAFGFSVNHNPLPDNAAHALVEGENNKAKSRELAKWVSVLPGVESRDPLNAHH